MGGKGSGRPAQAVVAKAVIEARSIGPRRAMERAQKDVEEALTRFYEARNAYSRVLVGSVIKMLSGKLAGRIGFAYSVNRSSAAHTAKRQEVKYLQVCFSPSRNTGLKSRAVTMVRPEGLGVDWELVD